MQTLKRPRGRPPKNGKCKCGLRVAFSGTETELDKLALFHGGAKCDDWPNCADGLRSKRCRHEDDGPELWTNDTFLNSLMLDRSASYLMACMDTAMRSSGHVACETCSGGLGATVCDACDKLRMENRRLRTVIVFQAHTLMRAGGVDVVSTRMYRLSVGSVYSVGPAWARHFVMDDAAQQPLFTAISGTRIRALATLCVYVCGSSFSVHLNRAGSGCTFVATILIQRWWRRCRRRATMLLVYGRVRSGNCTLCGGRFGPAAAIIGGPSRVYTTAVKAVRNSVRALVTESEPLGDANDIIYTPGTPTGLAPAVAAVVEKYWFAMRLQRSVCYSNYHRGRRVYCSNTYTALNVCHMTIIKGRAMLVGTGSQFSLLGVVRTITKCTRTDTTLKAEFSPSALPDQRIDPELMVTVYNHPTALVRSGPVHATLTPLLSSVAEKLNDQNPHLLIL